MVAMHKSDARPPINDSLRHSLIALREVNAAAKSATSKAKRRHYYDVKDMLLNHLIANSAAQHNCVRLSGRFVHEVPMLIVTIQSVGPISNLHMPINRLSPAARRIAAQCLGPQAQVFRLV